MRPAPPQLRPPTGLVPSLPAHDLAATRDFYVRDLGLGAAAEEPGRLLLRVGGACLEFRQHDGPAPAAGGLQLTFTCAEPGALLQRLRALGVEVEVPPGRSVGARFFARDPDGRLVAFREDGHPAHQ